MTYDYAVTVARVVDGDTLDLDVDLGFYLRSRLRFRLLGIDAPERGQPGYAEAMAAVRTWLDDPNRVGVELRARTYKADAYRGGRRMSTDADLVARAPYVGRFPGRPPRDLRRPSRSC